jgi:uncharacterized protein (DUF1800 family)
MRHWLLLASVSAVLFLSACGGGAGGSGGGGHQSVTISVTPTTANVRAGDTARFLSQVSGTGNTVVTWSVNGVAGGNATVGTINAIGQYTAPNTLPSPNNVQITATSNQDSSKSASAQATVLNPIAVISYVDPPTLLPNVAFTINVIGNKFVNGATAMLGSTALTTTFVDASHLTVTGNAPAAGLANLTITNPDPGQAASDVRQLAVGSVSERAAVRFLEQSTFGPVPPHLLAVESRGMQQFLLDQFAAAESTYPDPDPNENVLFNEQHVFFRNALNLSADSDQLRQRVVFALNQIWVVSGNKVGQPKFFTPYVRLLADDAFTNYRKIMEDVTLNPAMGLYLDMVNNAKPDPIAGTHANENYARELLQLFTIGPNQLNADGTPVIVNGGFVATYDQATIQDLARAFTGWTFPGPPLNCAVNPYNDYFNPQSGIGPMPACDSNHDTDPKNILGVPLPGGQSANADLDGALDAIFNHANLPPFVAKRFIRAFVTSNPSSGYVTRVATAFANGVYNSGGKTFGNGQRGDMKALIASMLLDTEARRGDNSATENLADGHLREPVLLLTNVLRAFNVTTDGVNLEFVASPLGQFVFYSPSVFNFYSPEYKIPLTSPPLFGPEFQLFTTSSTLNRANTLEGAMFTQVADGTRINFGVLPTLANDPPTLVEVLNRQLLHGTMSPAMKTAILNAVNVVPNSNPVARVQTAAYLIISSSQYQVQR